MRNYQRWHGNKEGRKVVVPPQPHVLNSTDRRSDLLKLYATVAESMEMSGGRMTCFLGYVTIVKHAASHWEAKGTSTSFHETGSFDFIVGRIIESFW